MLLSYVWPPGHLELRARVVAALLFLVGGKLAGIAAPFAFKNVVDSLHTAPRPLAAADFSLGGSGEGSLGALAPPPSASVSAPAQAQAALEEALTTLTDASSHPAIAIPVAALLGCA